MKMKSYIKKLWNEESLMWEILSIEEQRRKGEGKDNIEWHSYCAGAVDIIAHLIMKMKEDK